MDTSTIATNSVRVMRGAPPSGDAIFMSCDYMGNPGRLNRYVLQAVDADIAIIPSEEALSAGYAIVEHEGRRLVFIVTIPRKGSDVSAEALALNLMAALQDPRLEGATSLWLPLMGTGDGRLNNVESVEMTCWALNATKGHRSPSAAVVVSAPEQITMDELASLQAAALNIGFPRMARHDETGPVASEDQSSAPVDASVFYASPAEWDSEWLDTLAAGQILFWIKNGASHSQRLQRGHTVVLLAGRRKTPSQPNGGAVLALGVLAAGSDRTFRDDNHRRWPVLITQVFDREQFTRERVEAKAGPLVKSAAGGVHAIDAGQIRALSDILGIAGAPPLPYDDDRAEEVLARGETIETALRRHPYIREIKPGVPPKTETELKSESDSEPPPSFDAQSEYLSDSPAHDVDLLDRGEFAVALARRLHDIWCRRNDLDPKGVEATRKSSGARIVAPDDTFIVHVDAPWGGGKTTFANFVAKVLNPRGARLHPDHFLSRYAKADDQPGAPAPSLDGVFLGDFNAVQWEPHPRAGRRPWIIACSNAWRYQDVEPPWWQIYLDVAKAVRDATLEDLRHNLAILVSKRARPRDKLKSLGGACGALGRWLGAVGVGLSYRLLNPRLFKHLVLTVLAGVALWLSLRFIPWKAWNNATVDAAKIKTTIELAVLGLGALGGGLASLGALITQSLAPDIDFSGETKRIGVGDPIARFRKAFRRILELGRRPVLLIVDDLDRCPPKQVVELLRGFQTILQSPRMFVMILGDRHWIENAHSTWHADMKDLRLGAETSLGARFVEKVFQLSFVLPAMSDESRDRYTRAQLGEAPVTAAAQVEPAARSQIGRAVDEVLNSAAPASERERSIHGLIKQARRKGDDEAAVAAVEASAASRITAESVGDVEMTQRSEKLLAGLAPLLPNNPRQIKRVINAFPLFAAVGARFFDYRGPGLLSSEADTLRWRQLALWVALSIEWPQTWRRLAAEPWMVDAAFAPGPERTEALRRLTAGLDKQAAAATQASVAALRADPALSRLLGTFDPPPEFSRASALFARTRVETAAVWKFNRIIWEAGFDFGETEPTDLPPPSRRAASLTATQSEM